MAMTANGYIAKENDETPWPEEEWNSFRKIARDIGSIVIGRRTYEIMLDKKEIDKLDKIKVIVVTSKNIADKNIIFANSIEEALKIAKKQGFDKVLLAGGSKLNSSFIKENLIDEIYLDIEPILFGKGIKLFSDSDFEANLELLETKKLSKNEIQLHYKIKK